MTSLKYLNVILKLGTLPRQNSEESRVRLKNWETSRADPEKLMKKLKILPREGS